MAVRTDIIISARDVATKQFNSVTRSLDGIRRSVFGLNSLIAGAAVTGMGMFVKRSLEAADAIGKTADKVGLATDQLQELRYAAEASGVAQNTLDMAMQRFSRRIGEVAQGTGELKNTAEQYGVQLRDSSGQMRSNIAILSDFADVIRNAESEQERLRIAFKLFDSEGAALVNMLRDGSDGLDAMRQRAQDLGLVMEERLIRNAEETNTKLDTLAKVLQTRVTAAVVELAPEIDAAAKNMLDWVAANKEFLTQDIPGYIRSIAEAVDSIKFGPMSTSMKLWSSMTLGATDDRRVQELTRDIENLESARDMGPLGPALEARLVQMREELYALTGGGSRAQGAFSGREDTNRRTLRRSAPGGSGGGGSGGSGGGPGTGKGAVSLSHREIIEQMSGMPYEKWRRQNVTSPSMAIDRHNMVTGAMNTADLERQAKEAARVHGEAADEVRDNWRDAGGDILSTGRETFTALDRFAQDASWGMSSSISNFLYNAKDGFADLGDFAMAVFDSIWRASANMAGDQITGFITSGIGSLFSGGPAPGGFGRASAANPTVVGFDSGGWLMEPVMGRGLRTGRGYALAENGPELVSNPRRGQVGGDVIVNVHEAPRGTRVERSTVNGSRQLDIFIGEAVKRRLKAGDHELRSLVRGA